MGRIFRQRLRRNEKRRNEIIMELPRNKILSAAALLFLLVLVGTEVGPVMVADAQTTVPAGCFPRGPSCSRLEECLSSCPPGLANCNQQKGHCECCNPESATCERHAGISCIDRGDTSCIQVCFRVNKVPTCSFSNGVPSCTCCSARPQTPLPGCSPRKSLCALLVQCLISCPPPGVATCNLQEGLCECCHPEPATCESHDGINCTNFGDTSCIDKCSGEKKVPTCSIINGVPTCRCCSALSP